MAKITTQSIQEQLNEIGWKLISNTYKNLDSELEFQCAEGHSVFSTWNKIRKKAECPICNQNQHKVQPKTIESKRSGTIRVLALDQATHISGYSVFDDKELVRYGTFEAEGAKELERDHNIKEWLISMIQQWKPDIVAIEGIQYQQDMGVTTFETLARLQGILLDATYEYGVPYLICPTNTWRAYSNVRGRARVDKKRSMQLIIKSNFDISVSEDEADAIGIGIYASGTQKIKPKIHKWE